MPPPVYSTSVRPPWSRLDTEAFKTDLLSSALCRFNDWSGLDVKQLALLYDRQMTSILDRHFPARSVVCRRARQTLGLTIIACPAAKRLKNSTARSALLAGQIRQMSPLPRLPMPLGPCSVEPIWRFVARRVNSSGGEKSTPNAVTLVNCGGPLTLCWAVVEFHLMRRHRFDGVP